MRLIALSLSALFVSTIGCAHESPGHSLVGAWRGGVQFSNGPYAPIKDAEFMYLFNAGGTMLESSNYDAAPPVPPAYGTWKKVGDGKYEATYAFYPTNPPKTLDELTKGSGWSPAGLGVLKQTFTLSADGKSFKSNIRLQLFDSAGKPIDTENAATASGMRME